MIKLMKQGWFMHKKLVLLAGAAALLAGCASTQPAGGFIYADVQGPVGATSLPKGPLRGESCAASYLGAVALGDASITAAAREGGINLISHIEHASTSILFFYNKYCTIVWGHKGGQKAAPAAPANPPAGG